MPFYNLLYTEQTKKNVNATCFSIALPKRKKTERIGKAREGFRLRLNPLSWGMDNVGPVVREALIKQRYSTAAVFGRTGGIIP